MNIETDLPSRRVNGRMWVAGQSGNPAGRPVGARGRFSQQFIEDMRASWERHGATVMDRVAVEYPDRYLGIAAHLIPEEVTATICSRRIVESFQWSNCNHLAKLRKTQKCAAVHRCTRSCEADVLESPSQAPRALSRRWCPPGQNSLLPL